MELDQAELNLFVRHYAKLMYQAIMSATQKSLGALKRRLGSKTATGIQFMERPFFDVDVELKVSTTGQNRPGHSTGK